MISPQEKDGHVIVTVIMADSPVDMAVKKRQKPALFRKISAVTGILSNRTQTIAKVQPEDRSLSPTRNNMLSSDLIVHPPCNGKFTAELKLKNIIGKKQKKVVVKVSGTRLEILFAENTKLNENNNEKHITEINKTPEGKIGKLFKKNIFNPPMKFKRRHSDVVESKPVEDFAEEKRFKVHGQIQLPDYINSETLGFSINFAGNLNIQADIKGAIRPVKIFCRETFKLDAPSLHERLTRSVSLHAQNSHLFRKLSRQYSPRQNSGSCQGGSSSVQITSLERLNGLFSSRKNKQESEVPTSLSPGKQCKSPSKQIFNKLPLTGSPCLKRPRGLLQLTARSSSSIAHGSPLLKKLLIKNFRNQTSFQAMSPLAGQQMKIESAKHQEVGHEVDEFSHSESLPSSPFSSARLYKGTTTYEGVFRPWVSVKVKGKKAKKSVDKSCSWELMTSSLNATSEAESLRVARLI